MSSLYLHIPFCSNKCAYCDFFSQIGTHTQLAEYVELLNLNIRILHQQYPDTQPFETVFLGGGTPSLLTVAQLESLLRNISERFKLAENAEITLEANPGTINLNQLKGYRQAGVNRLSLGIQSLNNRNLQQLERIHSAEQALASVSIARAAGFDNLSLDLMFALPGQALSALEQEISSLLELHPEHISLYGLSFEEGTEFAARQQRGELKPCGEDLYAAQYRLLHDQLLAAGFEHYEISNFARPGYRCRHNQVYWQRRTCLAAGCGAHSFSDMNWGERRHIPADLNKYRDSIVKGKNPAELLETYGCPEAMKEFIYLALRTSDGFDLHAFEQQFHQHPQKAFTEAFNKTGNYLRLADGRCYFDLNGWLLYDHLISYFL